MACSSPLASAAAFSALVASKLACLEVEAAQLVSSARSTVCLAAFIALAIGELVVQLRIVAAEHRAAPGRRRLDRHTAGNLLAYTETYLLLVLI